MYNNTKCRLHYTMSRRNFTAQSYCFFNRHSLLHARRDQETGNSIWDKVFDDSGTSQDEEDQEDTSRIELQNYLKEKRSPQTIDPLCWWKVNGTKYPILSKLVRRFHSCPPGSAASERLFSTAKDVAGTKRLRLKPENLECLLFLKYNLRSLNGEKKSTT